MISAQFNYSLLEATLRPFSSLSSKAENGPSNLSVLRPTLDEMFFVVNSWGHILLDLS